MEIKGKLPNNNQSDLDRLEADPSLDSLDKQDMKQVKGGERINPEKLQEVIDRITREINEIMQKLIQGKKL